MRVSFLILRLATAMLSGVAGWLPVSTPAAGSDPCASPANPIVAENCQAGTVDWLIEDYTDTIAGYASAPSVEAGETLDFLVDTDSPQYDLSIYRSGYYAGKGGRLMLSVGSLAGHKQPACLTDLSTGLMSCSNWTPSYSLTVPAEWVSGIYLAKLARSDGGENYIPFIVRDDEAHSDILFQVSTTTYQAYNPFGGKSVYSTVSPNSCRTVSEAPRAVKVSFDRPYGLGWYSPNTYFWTDFPIVYWLEAQGYDVNYATDNDTHRAGQSRQHNMLLDHKAFLAVGHDEYWTKEMRDAITAARDAGVNIAFLSSNVAYWRIRLEADPWDGGADRVQVVYKTTESGASDPITPTTTSRDPAGVDDPENSLIGTMYIGDNDTRFFPLRVTADQGKDRIYRNTPARTLPAGSMLDIGQHLIGWEWDAVVDNGHTPEGLEVLASSPTYGALLADAGRTYNIDTAEANVTRYTAPSGAQIFAAGTNQWGWGLAVYEPNVVLQQVTYNVLADFGLQPATPDTNLKLDAGATAQPWAVQALNAAARSNIVQGVQSSLSSQGLESPLFEPSSPVRVIDSTQAGPDLEISNVTVDAGEYGAAIRWETNVPTDGQARVQIVPGVIDYRWSRETGWRSPVADASLSLTPALTHEVTVGNLEPGTTYYFHVASMDQSGRAVVAPEASFQTTGGSILTQVRKTLGQVYRSLPCTLRQNLAPTLILSVVLVVLLIGALVWGFIVRRRVSRT